MSDFFFFFRRLQFEDDLANRIFESTVSNAAYTTNVTCSMDRQDSQQSS